MDNYPALSPSFKSTIEYLDGIEVTRAKDGTPRVRSFWSGRRVGKMVLSHLGLSAANRTTLEAFYDAHRTAKISYSSRLTNYQSVTCYLVSPPQFEPSQAPGQWDCTINLLGA